MSRIGQLIKYRVSRKRYLHIRIGDHAANARRPPIPSRRIGRNGNGPGVKAAEEGRNEVKALREDEQYRLTNAPVVLQPRTNLTSTLVQFCIRERNFFVLAICQESACPAITMLLSTGAEQFAEIATLTRAGGYEHGSGLLKREDGTTTDTRHCWKTFGTMK